MIKQSKIILEKNFRCYFRKKYEALKELIPPLISAGIILLTCLIFFQKSKKSIFILQKNQNIVFFLQLFYPYTYQRL